MKFIINFLKKYSKTFKINKVILFDSLKSTLAALLKILLLNELQKLKFFKPISIFIKLFVKWSTITTLLSVVYSIICALFGFKYNMSFIFSLSSAIRILINDFSIDYVTDLWDKILDYYNKLLAKLHQKLADNPKTVNQSEKIKDMFAKTKETERLVNHDEVADFYVEKERKKDQPRYTPNYHEIKKSFSFNWMPFNWKDILYSIPYILGGITTLTFAYYLYEQIKYLYDIYVAVTERINQINQVRNNIANIVPSPIRNWLWRRIWPFSNNQNDNQPSNNSWLASLFGFSSNRNSDIVHPDPAELPLPDSPHSLSDISDLNPDQLDKISLEETRNSLCRKFGFNPVTSDTELFNLLNNHEEDYAGEGSHNHKIIKLFEKKYLEKNSSSIWATVSSYLPWNKDSNTKVKPVNFDGDPTFDTNKAWADEKDKQNRRPSVSSGSVHDYFRTKSNTPESTPVAGPSGTKHQDTEHQTAQPSTIDEKGKGKSVLLERKESMPGDFNQETIKQMTDQSQQNIQSTSQSQTQTQAQNQSQNQIQNLDQTQAQTQDQTQAQNQDSNVENVELSNEPNVVSLLFITGPAIFNFLKKYKYFNLFKDFFVKFFSNYFDKIFKNKNNSNNSNNHILNKTYHINNYNSLILSPKVIFRFFYSIDLDYSWNIFPNDLVRNIAKDKCITLSIYVKPYTISKEQLLDKYSIDLVEHDINIAQVIATENIHLDLTDNKSNEAFAFFIGAIINRIVCDTTFEEINNCFDLIFEYKYITFEDFNNLKDTTTTK